MIILPLILITLTIGVILMFILGMTSPSSRDQELIQVSLIFGLILGLFGWGLLGNFIHMSYTYVPATNYKVFFDANYAVLHLEDGRVFTFTELKAYNSLKANGKIVEKIGINMYGGESGSREILFDPVIPVEKR